MRTALSRVVSSALFSVGVCDVLVAQAAITKDTTRLASPPAPRAATRQDTAGLPRPIDGIDDYIIDPIDVQFPAKRSFPQHTAVRIVVRDVNPFLFTYSISAEVKAIPEPSPSDFFKAFTLGFTLPGALAEGAPQVATLNKGTTGGVTTQTFLTPSGPCKEMEARRVRLSTALKGVARADSAGATSLKPISATLGAANTKWKVGRDSLYNPTAPADTIIHAARKIAAELDTTIAALDTNIRIATDAITLISGSAADSKAQADALAKDYPDCFADKDTVYRYIARVEANAKRYAQAVADAGKARASAKEAAGLLRSTADNPQRFYKTRLLDTYEKPHNILITVTRTATPAIDLDFGPPSAPSSPQTPTPARENPTTPTPATTTTVGSVTVSTTTTIITGEAPKAPTPAPNAPARPATARVDSVVQTRINIGGAPRFLIGAGFAFAPIPSRQYSPLAVRIPAGPGGPGDTLRTTIGAPTISKARVTPILTLNTRLNDPWYGMTWHATLGAGLRTTGKADLDYLVGLSVSAFDQRVLLTGGAYFGETNVLAGGRHTGDALLTGTTSVPTDKKFVAQWAVGLSYRIQP